MTRRLILGFEKPSEAGSRRFSMPMRGGRTLVMSAPVPMSSEEFEALTETLKAWKNLLVSDDEVVKP